MKRHAPATARNSAPIAAVLEKELPAQGTVLELASGSGEHAIFFARRFPNLHWQPSDRDPDALASIVAWRDEAGADNLLPPLTLDASSARWPIDRADALVCINMDSDSCESAKSAGYAACLCINMVHISPWTATVGLFRGCAKHLIADAPLILYGPYLEAGVKTAQSNLAFDRSLKERNPKWGLRKVADVDQVATEYGFTRIRRVTMPAHNLTLIYHKE